MTQREAELQRFIIRIANRLTDAAEVLAHLAERRMEAKRLATRLQMAWTMCCLQWIALLYLLTR